MIRCLELVLLAWSASSVPSNLDDRQTLTGTLPQEGGTQGVGGSVRNFAYDYSYGEYDSEEDYVESENFAKNNRVEWGKYNGSPRKTDGVYDSRGGQFGTELGQVASSNAFTRAKTGDLTNAYDDITGDIGSKQIDSLIRRDEGINQVVKSVQHNDQTRKNKTLLPEDDNQKGFLPNWWSNTTNYLGQNARDVATSARDTMTGLYNSSTGMGKFFTNSISRVRNRFKESTLNEIPQIWEHFKHVLTKFGSLVQKGAKVVVERIKTVDSDIHGAQLIARLEKKLNEEDEQVAEFFQKVGEKVSAWTEQHNHNASAGKVDSGLEQVHQVDKELSEHINDPHFPDLFQEPEIQEELRKLIQEGIIEQKELELFTRGTNQEQSQETKGRSPEVDQRPWMSINSQSVQS